MVSVRLKGCSTSGTNSTVLQLWPNLSVLQLVLRINSLEEDRKIEGSRDRTSVNHGELKEGHSIDRTTNCPEISSVMLNIQELCWKVIAVTDPPASGGYSLDAKGEKDWEVFGSWVSTGIDCKAHPRA